MPIATIAGTLVDVVEQLDPVAERETQMLEEGRDDPRVGAWIP
jgi:hypothetical protein